MVRGAICGFCGPKVANAERHLARNALRIVRFWEVAVVTMPWGGARQLADLRRLANGLGRDRFSYQSLAEGIGRMAPLSMKARFEHVYVLDVMSDDHPGIVAAVSNAVESLGGNIDACSQTVLWGYFTLIMIVSVPEPIDPELLAERVRQAESSGSPYQVLVRRALPSEVGQPREDCDRFVITAFGKDQPGIVRRFSQYLAGKDINITDLYGDRSGDEFVLIGQLEVPKRWDIRMLQDDLAHMGKELGFTVKLQHENVFVATNQLRLTRTPLR